MAIRLERSLLWVEDKLSIVSAVPIVGTITGVTKAGLGGVQAISAIAFGILFGLPCAIVGKRSLLEYSWIHIKNGSANILAGIFESIPLVGTIIYLCRRNAFLRASFAGQRDMPVRVKRGSTSTYSQSESSREAEEKYLEQLQRIEEKISHNHYKNRILTSQDHKFVRYPTIEEIDWIVADINDGNAMLINNLLDKAGEKGALDFVREQYREIRKREAVKQGKLGRRELEIFYTHLQHVFSTQVERKF